MKSIINIIYKTLFPIIFFMIVIFVISYKPLLSQSPIAYNDWSYFFNSTEKNGYIQTVYSDDYFWSNLSSITFLKTIKWNLNIILKKTYMPDWIISYIMSFWLLYLVSLLYFFIFKNISQNEWYWYFAGIFVIFNNFTIESIAFWWFFYYAFWLISLALLLFTIFKAYERKQIRIQDIAFIWIISWCIILPIHLVIYALSIIIFFIFNFFNKETKWNYLLILSWVLIAWIHAYWIIPFIVNTVSVSSTEIYGWNASWVVSGYSRIANYLNIISFRQYFNVISFQLFSSSIVLLYYLVLAAGFVYISCIKKSKKYTPILLLFFIIYFIFFNISLWPNSYITGNLFQTLWNSSSVFQFFRSFTRFLIILIPLILLCYAIFLRENKINKRFIIWWIFITILLHYPLLTWNLKWVVPSMKVPAEYQQINNFLETYNGNKNIISYPNIAYETYSWSISWSNKMRQDYYLKEYLLNWNIIYDRTSLRLSKKGPDFKKIFSNKIDNNLNRYLENNSIDLVLVHKDYINIFNWWAINYNNFIDYFNLNSELILDNNYYNLYKLKNPKNILEMYFWSIDYKKVNSVEYDLEINLKSETDILNFYKNFDNNWSFYWEDWNQVLFEQFRHNLNFNNWLIDLDKVDMKNYNKNNDWTYTLRLKLYYKMQDYFILWKQISFWFIILIIVIFTFWVLRKKNEK